MAYCTIDDIIARVPARDLPGVVDDYDRKTRDDARIESAITDATAIIHQIVPYLADSEHQASRELLAVLNTIAVDIVMYRMVDTAEGSESKRKRYEDAIKLLREMTKSNQKALEGGVTIQTVSTVAVDESDDKMTFKPRTLL